MSNDGNATPRVERMFEALRAGGERVAPRALLDALGHAGLEPADPRLARCRAVVEQASQNGDGAGLDAGRFEEATRPSLALIERAVTGGLVIPEFAAFHEALAEIFAEATACRGGQVATYIPQLGAVDPEQFGLSICTVDGQRVDLGDARTPFCLQSVCKPTNYALALEELGEDVVHGHIGCEPSGHAFNELTLNRERRPHNPMINAGAIVACALLGRAGGGSLIGADRGRGVESFEHVLRTWTRMCGGVRPGFDNSVYQSERKTADRNYALGYFMRENGAFPEGADLLDTLEFYFQCCSIEATTRDLSVAAATLANGGVCPLTEDRVFAPRTVQHCLSLMLSCGMYDFSGEWAFRIGLPAKSGVSGAILVVVPNVLGACVWSPRLDEQGNSVRGVAVFRRLVERFALHRFDPLDPLVAEVEGRSDPRRRVRGRAHRALVAEALHAAADGDVVELQRLAAHGLDLDSGDRDGRTPLHLAAAEGQKRAVDRLLALGARADPVDRRGSTPADDARRAGHEALAERLERAAAGP
jgi:glutaminase